MFFIIFIIFVLVIYLNNGSSYRSDKNKKKDVKKDSLLRSDKFTKENKETASKLTSKSLREIIDLDELEESIELLKSLDSPAKPLKIKSSIEKKLKEKGVNSLWHMTHKDNIPSILKDGLLSHNLAPVINDISDSEVQRWRTSLCTNLHKY